MHENLFHSFNSLQGFNHREQVLANSDVLQLHNKTQGYILKINNSIKGVKPRSRPPDRMKRSIFEGLLLYKKDMISKSITNDCFFWNVSNEVLIRIEGASYASNKEKHNDYLWFHPYVAKKRFINLYSTGKFD